MIEYSICYQTITHESAESGDYADSGFMVEKEKSRLRDIISEAKRQYGIVARASNDLTLWWESCDPERDYREGTETLYTLHIPAAARSKRLFRAVNAALAKR